MPQLKWIYGNPIPEIEDIIPGIDYDYGMTLTEDAEFDQNDIIRTFISQYPNEAEKWLDGGHYLAYNIYCTSYQGYRDKYYFNFYYSVLYLDSTMLQKLDAFRESEFYQWMPLDMKKLIFSYIYPCLLFVNEFNFSDGLWDNLPKLLFKDLTSIIHYFFGDSFTESRYINKMDIWTYPDMNKNKCEILIPPKLPLYTELNYPFI